MNSPEDRLPTLQEQFPIALDRVGMRDHLFTAPACGGDAELICVLQKVMERFTGDNGPTDYTGPAVNPEAVAEWFYRKYGKHQGLAS